MDLKSELPPSSQIDLSNDTLSHFGKWTTQMEPEPADAAEEAPEPEDEGPTMNEIIRDVTDGRVTREEEETLSAE